MDKSLESSLLTLSTILTSTFTKNMRQRGIKPTLSIVPPKKLVESVHCFFFPRPQGRPATLSSVPFLQSLWALGPLVVPLSCMFHLPSRLAPSPQLYISPISTSSCSLFSNFYTCCLHFCRSIYSWCCCHLPPTHSQSDFSPGFFYFGLWHSHPFCLESKAWVSLGS